MASRIEAKPAPGGWIVLGLLLDRGAQSGYELATVASRSIDHFWPITKAQIYAELPRLEAAGFVAGVEVAQDGAPDKRVFKATRAGEQAFRTWIDAGELADAKMRHPLLLRIWFGAHLPEARLQAMVREQKAKHSTELLRFRALLQQVDELKATKTKRDTLENAVFRRLAIRHAIMRLEAEQSWLDEVVRGLGQRRDPKRP
jgi:DNA-binding PadR family transcriptional regulator